MPDRANLPPPVARPQWSAGSSWRSRSHAARHFGREFSGSGDRAFRAGFRRGRQAFSIHHYIGCLRRRTMTDESKTVKTNRVQLDGSHRKSTGAKLANRFPIHWLNDERSVQSTIEDWFQYVQGEEKLMAVPLSYEQRCGHLPQIFRDLVYRLRSSNSLGTK